MNKALIVKYDEEIFFECEDGSFLQLFLERDHMNGNWVLRATEPAKHKAQVEAGELE